MPPEGAPLLLDTHVWLWLLDGRLEKLGATAVHELEGASREGKLLVSVLSIWEIGMLLAKGRLRLALSLDEWVDRASRAPGLRLAELTPRIAIESTRLPPTAPADPADRIVVATALAHGARLATGDDRLLRYARHGGYRVLRVGT